MSEQPDGAPGQAKRNALIFVPGLGGEWVDQSIQSIGARLAHSLNRSAKSPATRFPIEFEVRQQPFGPGVNVSACTITYDRGEGPEPCVDLFKIDAVFTLRARYERWSLLGRMIVPLVFVLIYLRGVVSAARDQAGKTRRERYQVFFAIVVTLLMTGYVVALVCAGVKTIDPGAFDSVVGDRTVQRFVIAATALGLWKSSWVSSLGRGAVGYTSVIGYLGFGERRDQLVGQVIEVLDRMQEQDVSYERIDIVAYSFGTIAVLDAFFPTGAEPNVRLRDVNTLVTIGCPFDFVRTYWPRYFAGRTQVQDVPRAWVNIYEPADILASNFRQDGKAGKPQRGIPTETSAAKRKPVNQPYGGSKSAADAGALEFLTFQGLRSHSLYWGQKDEREVTVFDTVVARLYDGAPFMQ